VANGPEWRLLDLFCGGFGAGEGYRRAGWSVTGVDFVSRRSKPPGVEFIKANVSDVLPDLDFLRSFHLIHASPPCKANTRLVNVMAAQGRSPSHKDMLVEVRTALEAAGVPYIIENVEGADMRPDVMLCGSMFDLHTTDQAGERRWLRRHRLFELGGWGLGGVGIQPEDWHPAGRPMGVYGRLGDQIPEGGETAQTLAQARELMGTPWMDWAAISQAIPPAYTHYLGREAMAELSARRVVSS